MKKSLQNILSQWISLCADKNVERYVKQKCGVKHLENN